MKRLGTKRAQRPTQPLPAYLIVKVYLAGDQAGLVDEYSQQGFDTLRAATSRCVELNRDTGYGPVFIYAVVERAQFDTMANHDEVGPSGPNAQTSPKVDQILAHDQPDLGTQNDPRKP